jgi:hypothetical protein
MELRRLRNESHLIAPVVSQCEWGWQLHFPDVTRYESCSTVPTHMTEFFCADSVTGPDLGNYTLDASVLDPLPESNSYLSLRFKDWKINSGDMYKLNARSSNSATVPPSTSVSGVSAPSASTPSSTSLSGRASQTGSAPLSASTPPSGSPSQSSTTLGPSGASSAPTSSIVSNNDQAPKLGIVLGIGLGLGVPFLLLIGGITGFLLFRKRSRSHHNTTPELPDVTTDYPSFEVAGKEVVPELSGGVWRHELRVTERPVEMQG